jgi:hypothetical protein
MHKYMERRLYGTPFGMERRLALFHIPISNQSKARSF